jgi:hypothetical protein
MKFGSLRFLALRTCTGIILYFSFAIYYATTNIEVTGCLIVNCLPGNYVKLANAARPRLQVEVYFTVREFEEETSPYNRVIRCIN